MFRAFASIADTIGAGLSALGGAGFVIVTTLALGLPASVVFAG